MTSEEMWDVSYSCAVRSSSLPLSNALPSDQLVSKLFHQFGATRSAYGPKRPFLAVLDPVWPYNWPKWLEQEWCLVEQVNPYQNEAENIMGCHGKPTSKNP